MKIQQSVGDLHMAEMIPQMVESWSELDEDAQKQITVVFYVHELY